VRFFSYKSPMLSTPHLSPLPLRNGRGEKNRRSSYARWNPKADSVKQRKAFGIEE